MTTKNNSQPANWLAVLMFLTLCHHSTGLAAANTPGDEVRDNNEHALSEFQNAVKASDDEKAVPAGDAIFAEFEKKYRTSPGFSALRSKLVAAQFLAGRMVSQLNAAKNRKMTVVADQLFTNSDSSSSRKKKDTSLDVAPAKSVYETSIGVFSKPITLLELTDKQKSFLAEYYNLKLRLLTTSIAQAGQSLAVAEPGFEGTHQYVLVLPLLHASENQPINIAVLPRWMQTPGHLQILADACLLHFGFPYHAMTIAGKQAQLQEVSFSKLDFYGAAALKCQDFSSRLAAECLNKAIECVPGNDINKVVGLHFDILQLWLDSNNYQLASVKAKRISETYSSHPDAGKAIWLYHYALSRNNNADEILAQIDTALNDARCYSYKAKLMYIKWWALRRTRNQTAGVAAIEHELLSKYADDPMVAPIILSRATDLLAKQDYNGAREVLNQLVLKFSSTQAAKQAKQMMDKMQTVHQAP
jgi:hypothetical protein